MVVPRKIRKPDDIRPGSKKGKLDRQPIWLVKVMMPKTLVMDIYSGYKEMIEYDTDPAVDASAQGENEMQAADAVADPPAPADAGAVV